MERKPLPIPEYIKIPDLKNGYLYKILARNATYGIWIAEHTGFVISRIKFGDNFIFEEYHWDCQAFATARPIEEIEKAPFDDIWGMIKAGNKDDIILDYLNKFEGDRK